VGEKPGHSSPNPSSIWVILALAFGLRLGWALSVENGIDSNFMFDATYYFFTGQSLAAGEGFSTTPGVPTAYFPPGYPLILASAFVVLGAQSFVPVLINLFAGTATCWVTYKLGSLTYGPKSGLTAAAVLAFWPSHVYATSATMSEVVFTFLLTLVIYRFCLIASTQRGENWRSWIFLGLLLGFTSLVRGAGLLFFCALGLALFINYGLRRSAVRKALLLLVPLLVVNGLWVVRNQVTMGAPIVLATSGAWSFFNAHNEEADGGQSWSIGRYRKKLFGDQLTGETTMENDVLLHRLQMRYAAEYMLTHPLEEILQVPSRLYRLNRGDDWPLAWVGHRTPIEGTQRHTISYLHPAIDPVLGQLANGYYIVFFVLGTAGLVLGFFRSNRLAWIIPLTVIYFHGLHGILFFGTERFHAPFVPELALGAGLVFAEVRVRVPSLRSSGPGRE
jgi:4-amino-4-deoxy-L-arabinose transferase-like glycosyltransferase